MRIAVVCLALLVAAPAMARPGFYLGLGIGGTSVRGESNIDGRRFDDPMAQTSGPTLATTDMDGGATAMARLGFNILGYAALEAVWSGNGHNVSDKDDRDWAMHLHGGVRAYPLWHFRYKLPPALQPLEPSLFAGWGGSWQGWIPKIAGLKGDELGWSKSGTWRYGAGLEYFVINYFKIGLDYSYIRADYDNFIVNYDNGDNVAVDPPVETRFHQLYVSIGFQFTPEIQDVRYEAPRERSASPPPPPQPAPEPRKPAAAPEKSEDEVDI